LTRGRTVLGGTAPLHLICAQRVQLTPTISALNVFLHERYSALLASHPGSS